MPRTAVLLLAHGTPEDVSEIPDYLRNVTGGRAVPDSVIKEIQHRYGLIGRSPLTEITLRQGELLSTRLALPVYVGMRNWKPYIADTLHQMSADGIERCVAVCLAPQNSRTSVGLYRSEVRKNAQDLELDFVESWHDHPLLIAAFAERLESARAQHGRGIHVIFTAHSVPARTIAEGDPYEVQARETGALVTRALGLASSQWSFAFQSQGIASGPWIGPTVEETMRSLKDSDHDRVLIQPVGFVSDHVEVLYDIDIGFRDYGSQIGIEVSRPESLNDSPTFIAALADLVASRVQPEATFVSQIKSETKTSRARSE
jgi:protoporphyrin/coproporphyrin ferrochelatase